MSAGLTADWNVGGIPAVLPGGQLRSNIGCGDSDVRLRPGGVRCVDVCI